MKHIQPSNPFSLFSLLRTMGILCLCVLAGCGAPKKHYADDEARAVHAVFDGTVTNTSQVLITEDPDALVPLVGGAAGGAAGVLVGGTTMGVVGAIAGIYATGGGDFSGKRYQATELTIELEDERFMVIIIGSNEYFIKGDPVRVLGMGEQYVRVQHK